MAKEDKEKTAFITLCGLYYYTCMSFGLKNVGATFQRLIHIVLGGQMGRNVEAYVNNIMVRNCKRDTLVVDLTETITNLR